MPQSGAALQRGAGVSTGRQQGARAGAVPELRAPLPDGTDATDARAHTESLKKAMGEEKAHPPKVPVTPLPSAASPQPAGTPPRSAASGAAMPRPVETTARTAPPPAAPPEGNNPNAPNTANVPLVTRPAQPGEEQNRSPRRRWFWVAAGVGALLVGAMVVLAVSGGGGTPNPTYGTARGEVLALPASRRTAAAVGLCALAALAGAACDTEKSCRPATVFLRVEPGRTPGRPTESGIDVAVSGGAPVRSALAIPPGSRGGGMEIQFPGGYPLGQSVDITVTLVAAGMPLSTRMIHVVLRDECASLKAVFPTVPSHRRR